MMQSVSFYIHQFINSALESALLDALDADYVRNRLLALVKEDTLENLTDVPANNLLEAMDQLVAYAIEQHIIEDVSYQREIFEAAIMDLLTPSPSQLNREFWRLYEESPEKATSYFYHLSKGNDYIKTRQIAKNIAFTSPSEYGDLQITINLSKPEKDPKAIAAAKSMPASNYPQCLLCMSNEGYRGRANHPARQQHRLVRLNLSGEGYGFQYSPYVYYNEHSIFLNEVHKPMVIDRHCFQHLLDIVTVLPHYFAGSNADLPIVGGSILAHDHYQGGRHVFPMEVATAYDTFKLAQYSDVTIEFVKWPMSVIRLRSQSTESLVNLSEQLLAFWRQYSDTSLNIVAHTGDTPHNTITPIVRRKGSDYEVDLVLRNNRTNEQYPDGIFHPHPEVQHIKKENIGLIEVMGLAILPPRLVTETEPIKAFITGTGSLAEIAEYHQAWAEELKANYQQEPIDDYVQQGIGAKFATVLEHAGVYKQDEAGKEGIKRFLAAFADTL